MRPLQPQSSRARTWLLPLTAVALGLGVYWPALHGSLVWDDAAHVTAPSLQSWSGLARIWFRFGATQQYYPVLHTAFWLEHRCWGDAVVGYHLLNVLLHAINACLLTLLVRRLASSRDATAWMANGVPLLAAALFVVHPVAVESVAWISEQKNTLSLALALPAALAYLVFDERRNSSAYVWASVLFVLALGTKSVTAMLPPAVLVLLWWRHGRLDWRRDVVPLLPWFVVAVGAGLTTAWVERTLIGASGTEFDLSLLQRVALSGRILGFYAAKVVAPRDLIFIYPHWTVPSGPSPWLLGPLAVVAVTVLLVAARRRAPGLLAGWLLYVGILVPALGFVNVYPFRFSYVADHFQYHALPVALVLIAAGLVRLGRKIALIGGFGLVVALAFLARAQSGQYASGEVLYRATLDRNPECWMAHNNLGVQLARSPAHRAEAESHYQAALVLKPDYADAHNNYGLLLLTGPGRRDEAVGHFTTALRLQPDFFEAELNLGHALAEQPAHLDEAIAHYRHVLVVAPGLAPAHFALANTLARSSSGAAEADAQYVATLRLDPRWAEARVNYGSFLATRPEGIAAAITQYEEALRLDPKLVKAHYDLGNLFSDLPGREAEARREYEAALNVHRDYVPALNNLGILEAKARHFEIARQLWLQALAADPRNADAARNLEKLGSLDRIK